MEKNIIVRDKIRRIVLTYTNKLGFFKEASITPLDNGMYNAMLLHNGECVGTFIIVDDEDLIQYIFNEVFATMKDVCMKMEMKGEN